MLGKGGCHIAQIRQMSGARVQLQAETEGGGRVLMVSGLPEQCHTAHSMANAFLSEPPGQRVGLLVAAASCNTAPTATRSPRC